MSISTRECVPVNETSFKFLDRDRRSTTSINDSGKHLLYPLAFCLECTPGWPRCISTGSLELDTSCRTASPNTFRSPSSWLIALLFQGVIWWFAYTGRLLLYPAAARCCVILVCLCARRSARARATCCYCQPAIMSVRRCCPSRYRHFGCCADVPSCLLYKRLHSWRSVLLSSLYVVLTCNV